MNQKIISKDPIIYEYDSVFDLKICNEIIEISKPGLVDSTTLDLAKTQYRNSSSVDFVTGEIPQVDYVINSLISLSRYTHDDYDPAQVTCYSEGGEYLPHFDSYQRLNKDSMQRTTTYIVYLNDGFIGGETYFPKIDMEVLPKAGKVLMIRNCFENSEHTHPYSLHQSKKIKSGYKYILTIWAKDKF